MATCISSWYEIRSILDGLNRKLLKKPNLSLAITQLNSLSLKMQDEELARHSVICHAEQASIYQKMGNHNEERKQYLVAAHLLSDTFQISVSNRSRIQTYFPDEIADFYSRSIKLCLDMKATRLAGLISLEAAKVLTSCEHFAMAIDHAERAVSLLEGEFFAHTRALYCLATIHFCLYQYEHLLSVIDDLWVTIMKNRPRSSIGRRMLKDLEVITVLIMQRTKLCPSGRHRVFKNLYEINGVRALAVNSANLHAVDSSSLSPREYSDFKNFLSFLSMGKVREAKILLFNHFSTPKETRSLPPVQLKFEFLSPLGIQVICHFLDEGLVDYGG
ncbi:hypothetical protein DICVIV_09611 [Dictyocaulus viviparus]|uniref:Uncharacterized protein n=1 Tax=Dictyocaulus viviparus TaxID=29172 RepID=A0A0D8XPS1_DICVI|nr:hypothetical protein DICVIV_09611 [Dictyocaulus viviparus]